MYDPNERLELVKAEYMGHTGKWRRVEGKLVFIRSKDKKVMRGPNELRGKRLLMKSDLSYKSMVDCNKGEIGRLSLNKDADTA